MKTLHCISLSSVLMIATGIFLTFGCSELNHPQLSEHEDKAELQVPGIEEIIQSGSVDHGILDLFSAKAGLSVSPGESIQDAVDAAGPNQTIVIEPGIYHESIVVDKPGIKLIGKRDPHGQGVIIENPGDEENGIFVSDNGDGFMLARVTVRNFEENGVLMIRVNRFVLSFVDTINDGEYGLFPVLSSQGLIFHCSAQYHSDAGIYVGQSQFVNIFKSTAFGNVNGFEIENSSDIKVHQNYGYNNTSGLTVVLLPQLTVKSSSNISIVHNRFIDNNLPNFADPDDIAAAVPTGSGMLVIGSDNVTIMQNEVTGNDFLGIGIGSTTLITALAGIPPEVIDVEPDPDGVEVKHNTVLDNGDSPPPLPPPLTGLGVDLFWDGSGTANCWQNNTFETSFPPVLPDCREI